MQQVNLAATPKNFCVVPSGDLRRLGKTALHHRRAAFGGQDVHRPLSGRVLLSRLLKTARRA
jgi:hypothetical protein